MFGWWLQIKHHIAKQALGFDQSHNICPGFFSKQTCNRKQKLSKRKGLLVEYKSSLTHTCIHVCIHTYNTLYQICTMQLHVYIHRHRSTDLAQVPKYFALWAGNFAQTPSAGFQHSECRPFSLCRSHRVQLRSRRIPCKNRPTVHVVTIRHTRFACQTSFHKPM